VSNLGLHGVLPPIITPFKQNDDVDYDAFLRNIERWNNEPLAGYLVLGSNSETPYLNEEEKLKLIELTVQTSKNNRIVLAGTGLESARETIDLTNKAARLGAHAALVLTPFYFGDQMNDAALINYYTSVAKHSNIPILIYNVPKFTHLNISVNAVRVLSQHPSIIGMKDSHGDVEQLKAFKSVIPDTFNLVVGSASAWYAGLELGLHAAILAVANCLPKPCAEIQRLFDLKSHTEAKEMQSRLNPVNKTVTDTFGVAGLKHACSLLGYEGGFPRSPLLPLNDRQKTEIHRTIEQAGFLKQD
jgi:4-hydroxy-2-oxoglutarate aldolase